MDGVGDCPLNGHLEKVPPQCNEGADLGTFDEYHKIMHCIDFYHTRGVNLQPKYHMANSVLLSSISGVFVKH